jgi:hypothetical protein
MIRESYHYAATSEHLLHTSLRPQSRIRQSNWQRVDLDAAVRTTLTTIRLARLIGITVPSRRAGDHLPYAANSDQLVFEAPTLRNVFGADIYFLRGWKQFQSCIKGFNALGLMAEQVERELGLLENLPRPQVADQYRTFLRSRKNQNGQVVFDDELDTYLPEVMRTITLFHLAVWRAFAQRTIVCSTSSNMGISLHEALRMLQNTIFEIAGCRFSLLNYDEGSLIIWCPDERADFMNVEKALLLRKLEREEPPLTTLRTYINRQQRDPGALSDALLLGGYFFPTNPQSISEIQNLLFVGITSESEDVEAAVATAIRDPRASQTLRSLGCEVDQDSNLIEVTRGVEGGIHGLMVPYFLLYEEMIDGAKVPELETWNQASIGAALAAALLADNVIRTPSAMSQATRAIFDAEFPRLAAAFREPLNLDVLGKSVLHGVFDIANIQSLAQLLGVVVTRHLSGRSTAYVGLGSSSYSNGNRCFEILDESIQNAGAFLGRQTFHPATHTLNPIAQAMVFGEDLARCLRQLGISTEKPDLVIPMLTKHLRKPEPAGAAALAGLLLARLDSSRLSVFEIVLHLRELGFDKGLFLRFNAVADTVEAEEASIQLAQEEGPYMGQLMTDLFEVFTWPINALRDVVIREMKDRINQRPEIDRANIAVYLTGDNGHQPDADVIRGLVSNINLSYCQSSR